MKFLISLAFVFSAIAIQAQTSITPLSCVNGFYHGVASGDPLSDRVIIWTRVTPTDFTAPATVNYQVALDTGMVNVVASGTVVTDSSADYTVKVDVIGLQPDTYYYYEFSMDTLYSQRGRTKTTPVGNNVDSLRFAVVSCANLEAGYFNAYRALNERNDFEAVLMLGDYIYEYEEGGYSPNPNIDRIFDPVHEIVSLEDYRLRYSVYHMDQSLRQLHQNFPWICVWDDHESANDSYKDGAENHNPGEGLWADRKLAAQKAYFEWMPIRQKPTGTYEIHRSFPYGDLLDLFMVDTRLHGRDEQGVNENDPNRSILGNDQYLWLKNELQSSTAKWKILGNQVVMAPIEVFGVPINPDAWDGYPANRQNLWDFIVLNGISNFTVLTGDVHTSWAFNLENGSNHIGVEFVTPSITSPGIPLNAGGVLTVENPHIKFVELTQHGFLILDVNKVRIQSDWYFVNTIDQVDNGYSWAKSLYSEDGQMELQNTTTASSPSNKYISVLSPECPRTYINDASIEEQSISVLGIYPNPAHEEIYVHFTSLNSDNHLIRIIDINGRIVKEVKTDVFVGSTINAIDLNDLQNGIYYINIQDESGNSTSSKFVKR